MDTTMDDKTQKRVQTVIAIVLAIVLSRPINMLIDEQSVRGRPAGGGEDGGLLRGVRSSTQVGRDAALTTKWASERT